jgi:hypothetical protein
MSSNRLRVLLVSLLAAFAISAVASATSASASTYKPGIWLCVKVASNKGAFNNSVCTNKAAAFNWTWAYFNSNTGELFACEQGHTEFEDSYCSIPAGTGPFGWVKWGALHAFPGVIGASKLKGEVAGAKLTVECAKGKSTTGKLIEKGASKENILTYEECKVVGTLATKCEVKSTLVTNDLKGSQTQSGRTEDTFEPEAAGGPFIEIELKAIPGKTCTPAATYKVTGSQTCEVDTSNAVAKETKSEHELICKPGSNLKLGGNPAEYEGTVKNKLEVTPTGGSPEAVEYFVEE